jgi:hypothetical protein
MGGVAHSTEIVQAFADVLLRCVVALRTEFSGADRLGPTEPLQLVPRLGGLRKRSGLLEGLGDYQVHGHGCRFELSSGALVDFDWDQEGRETFDVWRLRQFAQSIGYPDATQEELAEAARSEVLLEETRPGWFALALLSAADGGEEFDS